MNFIYNIFKKSKTQHNIISKVSQDTIKIEYQEESNFIDVPQGIKKILIGIEMLDVFLISKMNKSHALINLSNMTEIKKILYINKTISSEILSQLNSMDMSDSIHLYLAKPNPSIDLKNLPSCIKSIQLYDGFDGNLDYLPDTIKKITFEGKVKCSLANLPLSVQTVWFNILDYEEKYIICELPSHIEFIYFNLTSDGTMVKITSLPEKLKKIEIEKDIFGSNSICVNCIEKFKKKNNLNFDIECVKYK